MGNLPSAFSSKRGTTAASALIAFFVLRTVLRRGSAVRKIAGPPSPSWIFGNMLQLLIPYQYGDHEFGWQKIYGALYRIKGCFGEDRLIISDPVALQFIVTNLHKFEHSPMLTHFLGLVYDKKSIVSVRGDEHRRLRAAFNPGFSAAGVRGYQVVMQSAAEEIARSLDSASTESVDLCRLLSTATLSAISEAVLGCKTEDLGAEFVEIITRMVMLASVMDKGTIVGGVVANRLPTWVLRLATLIPTPALNELRKGLLLAKQIGRRLVQEKLTEARQGLEAHKDVFSQILNADQSDKTLTEEELEAQTSLMIIAGQETTANTLAFGLTELARNIEFQDALRREIHASHGGGDVAYNNMPLLNAFIKELLRLYPVLAMEERMVAEDTVIPLMDSITTSTGERLSEVPVRKGQIIFLGIAAYQRLESIWGADAAEFKPSRWIEEANSQSHGPAIGPYANLLAFFSGARTCLGWRFAILEMQVIICELVGKFSFGLPEGEVARMNGASVVQPIISDGKKAAPLRVTRIV
ncbi:cytochrome P450 [Roridomyces roridus]|uniref:Cytochrome P450 n=1 Tax=Roridomyces roridus TaxID=1738132 RepID=A0AAD7C051_9AGAR|nr:cytochrome P450 [Roridomyces roridus]